MAGVKPGLPFLMGKSKNNFAAGLLPLLTTQIFRPALLIIQARILWALSQMVRRHIALPLTVPPNSSTSIMFSVNEPESKKMQFQIPVHGQAS